MAKPKTPPEEAFYARYRVATNGCWIWTGDRSGPSGYGSWLLAKEPLGNGKYRKIRIYAHRLSWQLHHGEIPGGMRVLHECDTPLCVNPNHLFLGTAADNTADMVAKGRDRSSPGRGWKPLLKEEDVRTIRASNETNFVLAERYGLAYNTIHLIRARKIWRHVP